MKCICLPSRQLRSPIEDLQFLAIVQPQIGLTPKDTPGPRMSHPQEQLWRLEGEILPLVGIL